jgi:hypothetical protein
MHGLEIKKNIPPDNIFPKPATNAILPGNSWKDFGRQMLETL